MRRFWIHLKLYVHHLRRGIIPKRWPPRLIEPGRGKRYPALERAISRREMMRWRCTVAGTVTKHVPWQCESGSSMAPGHEDCDWVEPDPRVDQLWDGHQFGNDGECERCGVTHEDWFWSPDPLPCP